MNVRSNVAEKIAGEITLSPKPGQTIKKWRTIFNISQTTLAEHLTVSPSVISDYESGRRKSPGIQTIRKIIEALIELDEKYNNGKILQQYQALSRDEEGIIDLMEFPYNIPAADFIKHINGKLLTSKKTLHKKDIKGYTLIDGIKTIKTINSTSYTNLYGWSTERALIFTGVTYGRSPMIAIRIHPIKPSMVVYHKTAAVDPLAIQLAEREKIPLVVTQLPLTSLREKLRSLRR